MPTKIEWSDETLNPVVGCGSEKISPGCDHCYAERQACRGLALAHAEAITDGRWNGRMVWQDGQLEKFARWRKPRRIFMGSMGDYGLMRRSWFQRIWEACKASPHHTYMFLTKRPEFFSGLVAEVLGDERGCAPPWREPPPWFWLGVTAEDEPRFDERVVALLNTPAAVHFVSVEPMLGPIDDMTTWAEDNGEPGVDWVICGAETGPGARPMRPEWARSLRDQCKAAGVPFFFKKAGPGIATPTDLAIREWPEVRHA